MCSIGLAKLAFCSCLASEGVTVATEPEATITASPDSPSVLPIEVAWLSKLSAILLKNGIIVIVGSYLLSHDFYLFRVLSLISTHLSSAPLPIWVQAPASKQWL